MMKKKNKLNDALVQVKSEVSHQIQTFDTLSQWDMFVKTVAAHVDPVLASILFATEFQAFDQAQKIVHVATLKKFILFQDLFIEQKKIYQQYLDRIFGFQTVLVVDFNKIAEVATMAKPILQKSVEAQPTVKNYSLISQKKAAKESSVDLSDTKKWKITHALLDHFGGSVKEIVKDTHEFDA